MENNHQGKAALYRQGRPDYPDSFFDFLTLALRMDQSSVIADMGCGTGTVTRSFAKRYGRVYGVEPDGEMLRLARKELEAFPNFFPIAAAAENSGLPDALADCIFCGNSYHWFQRETIVPEFRRIAKKNGFVVIASLGPGANPYTQELNEIYRAFPSQQPAPKTAQKAPFLENRFQTASWAIPFFQDWDTFFSGAASASYAPKPEDPRYEGFSLACKSLFDRYQKENKLRTNMNLRAEYGLPEDLAL